MTAFFIRARAKRQRLSELVGRADDGFWTPGMGESSTSAAAERAAPAIIGNPKLIGNPKWSGRIKVAPTTPAAPVATVTITPEVVVVTITSLVEVEPSARVTLPAPSSPATIDEPVFDGGSTSAIKLASVSSAAEPSTMAPAPSSSSATIEEGVFSLPTATQIAVVSQSVDSASAVASSSSSISVSPSATASVTDEGVFSLSNATRIAVVATATDSSASSSASILATSAPVTSSSESERIFSTPSTRIAAVSNSEALPSSQLSAVSASLLSAFSASAASVASSSASAESSISAESSRSAASRAATFNDGPTPQPGTWVGSPSSGSVKPTSSARNRNGGAGGTAGESSAGQLFGSVPRSAASITVTVLVSLAIVLLALVIAFFTRRWYKRRQSGLRQLGSEGGTPRSGMWREKDMEEKGRFNNGDDDDADMEDIDPDAIWRRRVDRINSVDSQRSIPGQSRPHVSVAPEMSPISEQNSTSDWTSFVGDNDWGTVEGRSRLGSVDSNATTEGIVAVAAPVTKGLGVDTMKAPHPLRHSWVPPYGSPSSQYSPDEESLVAGSPFTPRTPPARPGTLKRTPSNIQQSLDRLVGSAAEYFGGLFGDDASSVKGGKDEAADNYTAFQSPRRAPPTPTIVPPTPSLYSTSPTQIDAPAFPDRAATYAGAAPEDISRPSTSRGTSYDRSPSDASELFLGITHAHVARNVRGKLGFSKEKGMEGEDVSSWAQATATAEAAGEQDALLDGSDPTEQDATSIDPFDDSHAETLAPPHNPPSSPRDRTDTPPPRVGQPLIPFLSPFGPPRGQPTADEETCNYSSDDTTSTVRVKRPISMGTIRPAPRKSLPLANSLLARRLSTVSTHSSDEGHTPPTAERHRTFSESQIVFRPRPVSRDSSDTFASQESEESSTESGGSDESDSSRAKRERMRRVERLKAEERARSLMAERRRRSEGELLKRAVE